MKNKTMHEMNKQFKDCPVQVNDVMYNYAVNRAGNFTTHIRHYVRQTRSTDDAKTGKINLIICKDLSRFGKNYIQVGQYTDYIFPMYNMQ